MIQARKPSSSRIYYRTWKAYFRWCESNRDKVVFRPPPSFLPKVVSTFHLNEDIVLPSFCPAPTHPLERSLNKLDLVRAVRIYLDRTSSFRKTVSFFVIPDGTRRGQPASKATIARWIRMAILEAYRVKNRVPPPGIKAHSTRAVGASWAVHHRASALQLCKAATWSSIHTFAKFYKVHTYASADASLGRRILQAAVKRYVLEETEQLDPRVSALEEDMDDVESSEEDDDDDEKGRDPTPDHHRRSYRDLDRPRRSPSPRYRRSRSRSPRRRSRSPKREEENGTEARVQGDTEADQERDDIDQNLNLQGIIEVTDTEATQNLQRGQRRVTKKADVGMSDQRTLEANCSIIQDFLYILEAYPYVIHSFIQLFS
ncbi:unnamed protein product [Ranitomeya imitator]|uniref:Tyr recombinase domain-containing protein n=1 Tax=Ranitomeya imitator TaxID=111125 RepID=A0ABN9LDQ5_9NEOB|nr:unnamed protein product [Ranitomeya imitator]